jgi:hypothetical protein
MPTEPGRVPRKPPLDEAAVAEIKRLYDGDELTVAAIAERFAIAPSAVTRLARTRGWVMRSQRRGFAPRLRLPTTARAQELVVHGMCEAIITKLKQMEAMMARGELSSEDFERDSKSVRSMAEGASRAAAKLTDADKERKPPPEPSAAAEDDTEAERISREIIERFEQIQRRRSAEGASG